MNHVCALWTVLCDPRRAALGHGPLAGGDLLGPDILACGFLLHQHCLHPDLFNAPHLLCPSRSESSWFKPQHQTVEGSLPPWPTWQGGVGLWSPEGRCLWGINEARGTGLPRYVRSPH